MDDSMAEEMGTMAYGPYAVGGSSCFTTYGEEAFFGNKEGLVHHVNARGGRHRAQPHRFQLHEDDVTCLAIGDYGRGPCLLSGSVSTAIFDTYSVATSIRCKAFRIALIPIGRPG